MNANINVTKEDSNITSIIVEGDMTIYSVAEVKNSIVENLDNCSTLNINLSMITKIDTAGFQLLLLAKRESEKRNISLSFIEPNQEVEHIFKLYGEAL